MATIVTSTRSDVAQWPASRRFDRSPNGHLWFALLNNAGTSVLFYRSTDNGGSWSLFFTWTPSGGPTILELSSVLVDDHPTRTRIYWAYRTNQSSQDRLYFMAAIITSSDLSLHALLQLAAVANGGVAGAIYQGITLAPHRFADGRSYLVVAAGTTNGAQHGAECFGVTIPAIGQPVLNNGIVASKRKWLLTGSGRITPSLVKEPNPIHLWLTFGRTSVNVVRLPWGGSGWAGPTTAQQLLTGVTAQDSLASLWTQGTWATVVPDPTDTTKVVLLERNPGNTKTTSYVSGAHTTGVVKHCTLAYNNVTRDVRVYAMGTSTNVLYYADFIRATLTWSGWSQVTATAILGSNADNYQVRATSASRAKYDVVTAHSGSPNTVVHTAQALTYPPFAPTWIVGSTANSPETNGAACNVSAALDLVWQFSDPDPADTQSAWALSRQIGAGALAYFRASDSTWQATEQKNVSGTSSRTLSSGWGAGGDANHTYRVKVWDSTDVASSYSAPLVVVPSVQVNPTITVPAVDGTTITADSVTVEWTASEQTAWRVKLQIVAEVKYDSGWQSGSALQHTIPFVLEDGFNYSIKLTTRNNEGLPSAEQNRNITVDFVEPPTPTLTVTPQPLLGHMRIVITNPAPSGGQPDLLFNDLLRRNEGALFDNSSMVTVATGLEEDATYDDWTARSGKGYEYRVAARGANGTTALSSWTP